MNWDRRDNPNTEIIVARSVALAPALATVPPKFSLLYKFAWSI